MKLPDGGVACNWLEQKPGTVVLVGLTLRKALHVGKKDIEKKEKKQTILLKSECPFLVSSPLSPEADILKDRFWGAEGLWEKALGRSGQRGDIFRGLTDKD